MRYNGFDMVDDEDFDDDYVESVVSCFGMTKKDADDYMKELNDYNEKRS